MAIEFKEKFSQLLMHYTSLDATIKNPDMPPPLTNQQVFDSIQEVLLDKLNITLHAFNSNSLKTPTNEIIVGTPSAPDVLRMDYNHNTLLQKRLASFNSAMTPNDEDDKSQSSTNLSSYSEEKMEVSDTDKSSTLSNNENGNVTTEKFTSAYDILSKDHDFKKELQKLDCNANCTVYTMVEDAHKNALKVMSKLEELRGLLVQPDNNRPNRRLSTIMNLPPLKSQSQQNLNHHQAPASTNHRTIARAKALRRSAHQLNDDVTVTPTSSRLSLVHPPTTHTQQHAPTSTKKPSGIAKPSSKLPSALGQHNRSNSSLGLMESYKSAVVTTAATAIPSAVTSKSPSRSMPMRSAKYAHVQSTIPKPQGSALKRKAV